MPPLHIIPEICVDICVHESEKEICDHQAYIFSINHPQTRCHSFTHKDFHMAIYVNHPNTSLSTVTTKPMFSSSIISSSIWHLKWLLFSHSFFESEKWHNNAILFHAYQFLLGIVQPTTCMPSSRYWRAQNYRWPAYIHSTKKPVITMLTYPWKCTVLHCNHLGNTWKPLVLMTWHWLLPEG